MELNGNEKLVQISEKKKKGENQEAVCMSVLGYDFECRN